MRMSPTRQAGRWNCANSGSPNGQNVFGFLETSEVFAFKQSKFFRSEILWAWKRPEADLSLTLTGVLAMLSFGSHRLDTREKRCSPRTPFPENPYTLTR